MEALQIWSPPPGSTTGYKQDTPCTKLTGQMWSLAYCRTSYILLLRFSKHRAIGATEMPAAERICHGKAWPATQVPHLALLIFSCLMTHIDLALAAVVRAYKSTPMRSLSSAGSRTLSRISCAAFSAWVHTRSATCACQQPMSPR